MCSAVLMASCKTSAPIVSVPRNDSVVVRNVFVHDSVYRHDSMAVAVFRDTVFVERWHRDVRYKIQAQTDTIWQDKEVVVTLPPERYVPQFYKWCAWIVLAMVVYIIVRVAVRVYLRR